VKGETKPNAAKKDCDCTERDNTSGLASPSENSIPPDALGISHSNEPTMSHIETVSSDTRPNLSHGQSNKLSRTSTFLSDSANRRKVANLLTTFGNRINDTALNSFDDRDFRNGPATEYPSVPGEILRNPILLQTMESYNPSRDADGNVTPLRRSGSFVSFTNSDAGSVHSPTFPSPTAHRRSHDSTVSSERPTFELQNIPSSSSAPAEGSRTRLRQNTLTVHGGLATIQHTSTQNIATYTDSPVVTVPQGLNSPAIVVSPGTRPASPVLSPATSPTEESPPQLKTISQP
jgi:hypothetical protein